MRRRSMAAGALVCALVLFNGGPITAQSPRPAADALSALKFRYIRSVA